MEIPVKFLFNEEGFFIGAQLLTENGGNGNGNGNGIEYIPYTDISSLMPLKEASASSDQHPNLGSSIYRIEACKIGKMVHLNGMLLIGEGFTGGPGLYEWYWDFLLVPEFAPDFQGEEPLQPSGCSASLYYGETHQKLVGTTELTTNVGGGRDAIRVLLPSVESHLCDFISNKHPFNGWAVGWRLRWSAIYKGI